jgi:hypothetical protein
MATVTVDSLLDQVAAALHQPAGAAALSPVWAELAPESIDAGYRDIESTLAVRGLTRAQIESWTGYDSALEEQSLFRILARGGPRLGRDVPQEDYNVHDLREWLRTITLLDAAGNVILADPSRLVGTGPIRGGWSDVLAHDPTRQGDFSGIIDPRSGRIRDF